MDELTFLRAEYARLKEENQFLWNAKSNQRQASAENFWKKKIQSTETYTNLLNAAHRIFFRKRRSVTVPRFGFVLQNSRIRVKRSLFIAFHRKKSRAQHCINLFVLPCFNCFSWKHARLHCGSLIKVHQQWSMYNVKKTCQIKI